MNSPKSTALVLALPWGATLILFWLFPLVYSFVMGFTDYRLLVADYQWVGWSNYRELFLDP
ncbi:MAG: sugar ABC transporter permease, partial [candidate division Zixibacteria bacterium]|nr:sugar ABC transporter permease [candidate division Zixibacteria bacterium]